MCELSNIRQPLSRISNIFSIRSPIFCGNAIFLPRTYPSIFIVPLVGYIKPLTARINIVFPEPFITMNYAGLKDDALTALIHLCIIESINNLDQQTQKAESTLPRIRLLYIHLLFSILYEAVNHRNHTIYTELCHIQAQVIVFCLPPLLSSIVFVIGLSVVICLTHNSLCLSH